MEVWASQAQGKGIATMMKNMKELIEQIESESLTEGYIGTTIVGALLPDLMPEARKLRRVDKMTSDLLLKVGRELSHRLEPKGSDVERAVNRLRNLNFKSSPANVRNQVFKVANELGMKLPSGIF